MLRTARVDLRSRLGAAIGHDLLDRFQSGFEPLQLRAILGGALGGLFFADDDTTTAAYPFEAFGGAWGIAASSD